MAPAFPSKPTRTVMNTEVHVWILARMPMDLDAGHMILGFELFIWMQDPYQLHPRRCDFCFSNSRVNSGCRLSFGEEYGIDGPGYSIHFDSKIEKIREFTWI